MSITLNRQAFPMKGILGLAIYFTLGYLCIPKLSDSSHYAIWPWLGILICGGLMGAYAVYEIFKWL